MLLEGAGAKDRVQQRRQRRLSGRGSLWGQGKRSPQHRHLGRARCCLTKVCMRRRRFSITGNLQSRASLASRAGAHDIDGADADMSLQPQDHVIFEVCLTLIGSEPPRESHTLADVCGSMYLSATTLRCTKELAQDVISCRSPAEPIGTERCQFKLKAHPVEPNHNFN